MKLLYSLRKSAIGSLLLISTLLCISPFSLAFAQATTGALKGVVTDQTGAVIQDADVTAKEIATGVEIKTKTNAEGLYNFPKLKPGIYQVVVERDGFKKAEAKEVTITIGQDSSLNVVLQPGGLTEVVTVQSGGEDLIQKEHVQISSSFESRKVAELPTNLAGNGIDVLALLAPGVVPGFGNVNSNGTTFSVNGNRARANNFTIDGQENNDITIGGPAFFVSNQDLVGEFQLITNNFSAEYGRNQGAVVNIVTKGGTNEFHGSAFWFHRDANNLDSLNNIEKRSGQEDPDPVLYNVFGGTFGGPIMKDRAWFFGSAQGITDREALTLRSDNPTIAPEELGRLRGLFPNNPVIQTLANNSAFALNDFGTVTERTDRPRNDTVTIGGQEFRVAFPQRVVPLRFTQKEFSVRGDLKINDNHSVWYRHLYQTVDNKNFLAGSNGFTANIPNTNQHGGANFTSQLSNTAVNEARFAFSRLDVTFGGGCEGQFRGCIPDPNDIGSTFTNINFTGFTSSGGTSLQTIGPATNLPQGRRVRNYQFVDNFSKTFGRHQLKMGADIRRITTDVPFLPNVNGAFRFPSETRVLNNAPSTVNLAAGQVTIEFTEHDQFYYFQDDWRIFNNLTLNLGVRYEFTGQPINDIHDQTLERESNPATALWRQNLPVEARSIPKVQNDDTKWAPRVGFAWSPYFGDSGFAKILLGGRDQTVISGGYSIAYEPSFFNILLNVSTAAPTVFLNTTVNPASGNILFPLPADPTGTSVQQFATSNNVIAVNTFDPRFFSQTIVPTDLKSPYSQQFSLRWQRELGRNNVVEARYVGTRGVKLFQTTNRNPFVDNLANGFTAGGFDFPGFKNLLPVGANPLDSPDNPATPDNEGVADGRVQNAGLIRSRDNSAQSTYHGLQTRYQGRPFNWLNVGAAYTFSKAIDNASEVFSFFESAVSQSPFNTGDAERGLSGFDRRHAFSLNWIWDIPAFKSQSGVLGHTLGGWQVGGTYFLANGQRFTPSQICGTFCLGNATFLDRTFASAFIGLDNVRPFVGNPDAPRTSVGISQVDASLIFGSAVQDPNGFYDFVALNEGNIRAVTKDQVRFIFNGPGAARIFGTPFGNVGRNSEVGPKLNQLNLALFKNINVEKLTRGFKVQVRAEFFNVLNHPNPGVGFVAADSTPNIFIEGKTAADSAFNDLTEQTFSRRIVQFGLKIIF
ncbi:MAG: carboxypeptidase regulatory-like domain-containing protein [Blastocatellia bacterium]|nr:carboxypeptidase regulatory-like domain-containing protein [Blastocatellia bacterium]